MTKFIQIIIQDIIPNYKKGKIWYNPCMSKNIWNKKQKKILYKNIGILFALTVLCAVLARSGLLNGGETLQDLADRQAQGAARGNDISEDNLPAKEQASSDEDAIQPEAESSQGENGKNFSADASQAESNTAENESLQQGVSAMSDRVTYRDGFYYESLNDTIKAQITGVSYPADDSEAAISYDTLRYVNVRYYNFHDVPQTGELICHKAVAQDLVEIFYELYEAHYPIEKIALIDAYGGDDELSMQDNNTSCFNYRDRPSGSLSNHAYGLAIDLNPLYNPYVAPAADGSLTIAPAGGEDYVDREQPFDHKIDKEDLAYELFTEHGFTWGGSWNSLKDYQHFEKEI